MALLSAIPYAISMSIVYPGVYPEEAGLDLVNQTILESAFCIITNDYVDSRNLMETATFIFFSKKENNPNVNIIIPLRSDWCKNIAHVIGKRQKRPLRDHQSAERIF